MQAKTPPRSGGVFVCHNNPEKLMCDKYYWWSRTAADSGGVGAHCGWIRSQQQAGGGDWANQSPKAAALPGNRKKSDWAALAGGEGYSARAEEWKVTKHTPKECCKFEWEWKLSVIQTVWMNWSLKSFLPLWKESSTYQTAYLIFLSKRFFQFSAHSNLRHYSNGLWAGHAFIIPCIL